MLSVTYKPFMQSVVMLNVVMLSVVMLRVVAPLCGPFVSYEGKRFYINGNQGVLGIHVWNCRDDRPINWIFNLKPIIEYY
jgi:hypothetical protein